MSKSKQIKALYKRIRELEKIIKSNKVTLTSKEEPNISVDIHLIGTELKFIKRVSNIETYELSSTLLTE